MKVGLCIKYSWHIGNFKYKSPNAALHDKFKIKSNIVYALYTVKKHLCVTSTNPI